MGCLTVNINQICASDACQVSAEDKGTRIDCDAVPCGPFVNAQVDNRNKELESTARAKVYTFSLGKKGKNIEIGITAALVCRVSLGEYEYFYVTEGPLIVEEGYFRVRRR